MKNNSIKHQLFKETDINAHFYLKIKKNKVIYYQCGKKKEMDIMVL